MTTTGNHLNLTVHYDADYEGYTVRKASNAFWQSEVPHYRIDKDGNKVTVHYQFDTKKEALEQVRRLNLWETKYGGTIEFSKTITQALFEAVADTKYGPAWN